MIFGNSPQATMRLLDEFMRICPPIYAVADNSVTGKAEVVGDGRVVIQKIVLEYLWDEEERRR